MTINLTRIFVLFATFIVCNPEPLNFKITTQTDSAVSDALIKVLQEAYNVFRNFLLEMNRALSMLASKRVMAFRSSALDCFSLVKGKTIESAEELEQTVKALNFALPKCLSTGMCAVGELLLTLNQTPLCIKLLQILDKIKLAYHISENLFELIHQTIPPTNISSNISMFEFSI